MDKTNDLILGVLGGPWCGLKYPGIEAYLVSIERSGFSGKKVMIVWEIQPIVRQKLIEYGFEVVEKSSLHSGYDGEVHRGSFFHDRMHVCRDYMSEHWKEFRYVFFLDIKDLILQNDPSIWMENNLGENSLVASNECVNIDYEETNKMWAQNILGEEKYQEIRNCDVINGGTWAGVSEAMAEVFHQVHTGCKTYTGGFPPCQIWINYVLHTTFKKDLYIPRWSEGFAACMHPVWSPWRVPCWPHLKDLHPILKLDTCVLHAGRKDDAIIKRLKFNNESNYNLPWEISKSIEYIEGPSSPLEGIGCSLEPKGKPFAIVHGYDRDWGAKDLFEFKYRFDGDFDLDAFKIYHSTLVKERISRMPIQRRGFRRVRHEGAVGGSKLPQSGRIFKRHL